MEFSEWAERKIPSGGLSNLPYQRGLRSIPATSGQNQEPKGHLIIPINGVRSLLNVRLLDEEGPPHHVLDVQEVVLDGVAFVNAPWHLERRGSRSEVSLLANYVWRRSWQYCVSNLVC